VVRRPGDHGVVERALAQELSRRSWRCLAVDAWKPAWGRWDTLEFAAAAFVTDVSSSRPIEFEVAPKDAEAMFDVLTYEKVGVMRMLEQYLARRSFAQGPNISRSTSVRQCRDDDLWKPGGASVNPSAR